MSPASDNCAARWETPLRVEFLDGDKKWEKKLTAPLRWRDPSGSFHEVPEGFVTDFASVPRMMRSFALDEAITAKAAVVHDYMYRVTRPTRRWADDLFYHTLRSTGVGALPAWAYWCAVRMFGWLAYNRYRSA